MERIASVNDLCFLVARQKAKLMLLDYDEYEEDLLAAARLGAIHASDRFNPNRGTKYITYAYKWIVRFVHNEVYRHQNLRGYRLHNISEDSKTYDLIASAVRPKVRLFSTIEEYREKRGCASLNYDDYDPQTFLEELMIEDETQEESELSESIRLAMSSLTQREQDVIRMRYFENRSFDEISKLLPGKSGKMGVTKQRAEQIVRTAEEKLRQSKHLTEYAY